MALRLFSCACGHPAMLETGAINRAVRQGVPIYCTRECAGLARRVERSEADRKEAKRLYDAARREQLAEQIRAARRAYHKRTYDPAKAAEERKRKMPRHIEYCRQPEYRAWKAEYDRKYRAKQDFGEFWESGILAVDLQNEVLARASRYEIGLQNGTINKAQRRRRDYEQTVGR